MTDWTPVNPGYEEERCDRTTAHGPHPWDSREHVSNAPVHKRWCLGIRSHPNTMIGQP